jgi:hypothetical protein
MGAQRPPIDFQVDLDLADPTLKFEAQCLIGAYGDSADVIAAQRSDASFCAGDQVSGLRWLTIFKIIAMSHIDGERDET